MILDYTLNTHCTARESAPGVWETQALLVDSLLEVRVWLEIRSPELKISKARYQVERSALPFPSLEKEFDRLLGVRVGPGMTKIVRGLLKDSPTLAGLVLEAMESVILAYTARQFKDSRYIQGEEVPPPLQGDIQRNPVLIDSRGVRAMAQQNPRLADSCIAFKEDA